MSLIILIFGIIIFSEGLATSSPIGFLLAIIGGGLIGLGYGLALTDHKE